MRKQGVLEALFRLAPPGAPQGTTAEEVAKVAGIHRHNASADLNELYREGLALKVRGRPVRFTAVERAAPWSDGGTAGSRTGSLESVADPFADLVGAQGSLRAAIEQAKAAMLYPPRGLPTLIAGPTGAGKSRLAEAMYHYAVAAGRLRRGAPFCVFNCADYAANPQLLLAQLFGYTRGAFTGAERDTPGLMDEAEGGLLFLDEIHRLPPEGQEMLFLLMDRGVYRALGARATRQAAVNLIAATSEDPTSSLLHTFIRRFPVVITLPELDVRPVAERLTLVEVFLQEEASRVGMAISVSPLVLAALLAYRATGNVGELRSAVLLGCAKAFLSHMATSQRAGVMALFLTHLAPQIQLAYLSAGDSVREAERLVGLEDRVYRPIATQFTGKPRRHDDYIPVDLYHELHRRVTGYLGSGLHQRELIRLIQTDLDYYLRRLLRRTDTVGRVPKRLLDVVTEFVSEASRELGRTFGQEVVTGLALHLASGTGTNPVDADQALALVSHCPAEYGVVRRMAPRLEAGLGMAIGATEMSFLALFLAAHGREGASCGLSVMVIAHGDRTASSMADVANRLLGTDRVVAVDMPLEQSVEQTVQLAAARVKDLGRTRGIVLLVDMGSLTGLGPVLEKETGVPFTVLPLVTTAAVIEAARVAGEAGADFPRVARAVRQVYTPQSPEPIPLTGKRLIVTTCLTGHGTARQLAAFLTEALPPGLRDTVTIQAVDFDDGSVLPGLLVEGWRKTVVAAAGTVDPHLPGVPFIGMEQILFGEGLRSLEALLLDQQPERCAEPVTREHAAKLACDFVADNMGSLNGRQVAESAASTLQGLEQSLGRSLSPAQVARWIIHLGFSLERLITDGTAYPCSDEAYLREHHADLMEAIRRTIDPIAEAWGVPFPPGEVAFLALIVLTQ